MIARILASAAAAALLSTPSPGPLSYRFDAVTSKVTRLPAGDESKQQRVAAGDTAAGGDLVQTGFFGKTVVSVPERSSRFEIGSSSRAKLQGDDPGVLLVLEKGRLKAFFDALTEGAPLERRVATPGALLAVRGTRYAVEISPGGETTLAVFEGKVEVFPLASAPLRFEPLSVRAGELCTFAPRLQPRPVPMKERGFDERSWDHGGSPRRGEGGPDRDGQRDGGARGPGGQGGSGAPQPGGQQPGGHAPGSGQMPPPPPPNQPRR